METPTGPLGGTLTGLSAAGVDVIIAYVGEHPLQTHPMIPLLQVTDRSDVAELRPRPRPDPGRCTAASPAESVRGSPMSRPSVTRHASISWATSTSR